MPCIFLLTHYSQAKHTCRVWLNRLGFFGFIRFNVVKMPTFLLSLYLIRYLISSP